MTILRWRNRKITALSLANSIDDKDDEEDQEEVVKPYNTISTDVHCNELCTTTTIATSMSDNNKEKHLTNHKKLRMCRKICTSKQRKSLLFFTFILFQLALLIITITYIDKIKDKILNNTNGNDKIKNMETANIVGNTSGKGETFIDNNNIITKTTNIVKKVSPPSSASTPLRNSNKNKNPKLVIKGQQLKNDFKEESLLKNSNIIFGATYNNGTKGYIADTKYVRYNWYKEYNNKSYTFIPMTNKEQSIICNTSLGQSITELTNGYKILTKVQVVQEQQYSAHNDSTTYNNHHPRILCAIYTISTNRHNIQIKNIIDTWGHRCDGFIAFSNETNITLGTINLTHVGPETYSNIWNKVRSIWFYIYEYYRNDYDIFHLSGDDTFLVVENLRYFISNIYKENDKLSISSYPYPLYLGELFPIQAKAYNLSNVPNGSMFCGGGSGYTINRHTLEKLIQVLPTCLHDISMMPSEDTFIGYCLLQANITPNSTLDRYNQQMYHGRHVQYIYDGYNPAKNAWHKVIYDFYNSYYFNTTIKNATFQSGINAASKYSIAFHRMWDEYSIKRHHAIIYKSTCPMNTIVGQQLFNSTYPYRE